MYEFTDSTEVSTNSMPAEAMRINGEYIENLISGYRTLHVSGRESMSQEITSIEIGNRSGSHYQSRRYPARNIIVTFQLIAESDSAFREAFIELNRILDCEEAELIFDDEPDKFFIGTPSEVGDIEPGRNAVIGEITFLCSDPFKYSVTEYTVEPSADDGNTFVVDYNGTHPAYPKLEAHFYESNEEDNADGDCGFIGYVSEDGKALQFGDPAEPNGLIEKVDEIMTKPASSRTWVDTSNYTLINEPFNSSSGWALNNGYNSNIATNKQVGTIKTTPIPVSGATDKAAQANSYGSGAKVWHGPSITKTLPSDNGNPATVGALDWKLTYTVHFCTSKDSTTASKQRGTQQCFIMDGSGSYVTGVALWKGSTGTSGVVRIYVRGGGMVKEFKSVDFSFYNARFGLKKKSTDTRNLTITITKKGSTLTYSIGGLSYSCTASNIASIVAKKVSFWFGAYDTAAGLLCNAVHGCLFYTNSRQMTASESAVWEDVMGMVDKPNTFTTNDVLIADCNDGSIRMSRATVEGDIGGELAPELGAIGNEWEAFALRPGINQIGIAYSDWVNDTYKPTFLLKYREVFL